MIKKGYINGVFIFIVCYFSIAFLGRGIFHKEIFPFFHWSLYSNIPQNNDQLQLLLVSENDKEVEVVNLLSKTDKIFTTPIELNTVLEAYYSCYKLMLCYTKRLNRNKISISRTVIRKIKVNQNSSEFVFNGKWDIVINRIMRICCYLCFDSRIKHK